MKKVNIDCKLYQVLQSEFNQKPSDYSSLYIIEKVAHYDRMISLLSNISNKMQCKSAVFGSITHGGYIPINCTIHTSFLFDCVHQENISANIENNKQYIFLHDLTIINEAFVRKCILYTESYSQKYDDFVTTYKPIIISNKQHINGYVSYELSHAPTPIFVLIPVHLNDTFSSAFSEYITENVLNYDNIINLCVMVKNGGSAFVSMLESTLPFIDRWTILDTGSTDDTVANVKRVMAHKPGALYQEPFINFGVSRNRCLELAGTQCTYNIMLDDTYHLKGDIRAFLQSIRGDQNADSFSIYITQTDIQYASNRIFKSKRNLKYKYAIHEVIDEKNNTNIIIPSEDAFIYDFQTDELNNRTIARKQQDLVMLQQEIDTNSDDPRPYYYMAQTYSGMQQFENAYSWFLKRINHTNPGFEQEKHEACIEAGRIAQFNLKRPPEEFLKHYELAHVVDPERPDSLYFLGVYYSNIDTRRAFNYLWKGFKLGFPAHRQYCLKPSITYTHIPKLLIDSCYNLGEYKAGEEASAFYLKNNKGDEVALSWNKIFGLLVHSNKIKESIKERAPTILRKPVCCFIAICGLHNWTGSDIMKKGMGGSESFVVEIASRIQVTNQFDVIVFCNCLKEEVYENVRYIPLEQLFYTLHSQIIHSCIVSRYSEYLPVVINSEVENIYLMAHDTAFSGNVITLHPKLKGVICLGDWHAAHIVSQYPSLKSLIKIIGHGIDAFKLIPTVNKIPYKFIYSSLANRGLYNLLLMWPKILQWQSSATLHIYCNIDSEYMLNTYGDEMQKIRHLINTTTGVKYYGYVDKQTLYESWKTADVWFYPTEFSETFCVTALEAGASQTLVIASNLAGLKDTVANRGILVDQIDDINAIIKIMEDKEHKKALIDANYKWASNNTWTRQSSKLEGLLMTNIAERRGEPSRPLITTDTTLTEIFNKYVKDGATILEIGVGSGIFLLTMMSLVKNSTGVAIFDCCEREQTLFDVNVRYSGFANRIMLIKSESSFNGLMLLSSDKNLLDVIYLNNESDLLDCYLEISVAWRLIKDGGLLVIDNLLEKRVIAVNQLLNKSKNASVIFNDSKRAFILKG
jgi:predicted O-methyltransferase YrrM/tetratricopeptide (TPR) repeat protein